MGHPLGMIQARRPRVVTSKTLISPSSEIENGKAPYWYRTVLSGVIIVFFGRNRHLQSMFVRVGATPTSLFANLARMLACP